MPDMWHQLKRHPLPIQAHFRHSLVLTYALPKAYLEPLLEPGLTLDSYGNFGFLAIAMVQTERLRPVGTPAWLGQDFFLMGYRVFVRFTTAEGRRLRGLRILRSDTDKLRMTLGGNLLTHYHYHRSAVDFTAANGILDISVRTKGRVADLVVRADLSEGAGLPEGSPFSDVIEARQFAGPLPFTFDFERETNSLICIKGVRKKWHPRPVRVEVRQNTFLEQERFRGANPMLANAFYVNDIPYRWERGRRETLEHVRPARMEAA